MDIEHCDCLSRFSRRGESHEQDGERLTRAKLRSASASGDPAMAFGPSVERTGRSSARLSQSAAALLPDEKADESCIRPETREPRRAQKALSGEYPAARSTPCSSPRRYERDNRGAGDAGIRA